MRKKKLPMWTGLHPWDCDCPACTAPQKPLTPAEQKVGEHLIEAIKELPPRKLTEREIIDHYLAIARRKRR